VTSRRRRAGHPPIDPDDAKRAVLGFANVVAGLLDFFGDLSAGVETSHAAKKAVRRGRARARALEEAEAAVRDLDSLDPPQGQR
jgi:hypothetical protein